MDCHARSPDLHEGSSTFFMYCLFLDMVSWQILVSHRPWDGQAQDTYVQSGYHVLSGGHGQS